jgi:uncharacterized protein (UPF0276 family)
MTSLPLVGVGYRRQIAEELFARANEFDCVECMVENFLPLTSIRRAELERIRGQWPVILHSVTLSVGSAIDFEIPLSEFAEIVSICEADYVGDHMSVSRFGEYDIRHLSPPWFTSEQINTICANVDRLQTQLGTQIALETITSPFELPHGEMSWSEFHTAVFLRTGCPAIIDVTNLYINELNHIGPEVRTAMQSLVGCATWAQFHIVGFEKDDDGFAVDSHRTSPSPGLLEACAEAVAIERPGSVILERDDNLKPFDHLVQDIRSVREAIGDSS